jgi:N-acetylmuramoyl-L-alanine amidase
VINRDADLVIRQRASPNWGRRKVGLQPEFLILHYTGMTSAKAAEEWLVSEASGVSSHYLVTEAGEIVQMVDEAHRAWHAGQSCWAGQQDINSASIGIEIANPGHEHGYCRFPDEQIGAVIQLCQAILSRHAIPPHHVLGHSDIAPARKEDPGELFPWAQFHQHGIGSYVPPSTRSGGQFLRLGDAGEPVAALQSMLALYGYCLQITGTFDDATRLTTIAFQRHFRPSNCDGIADLATVETLHALLADVRRDK